MIHKQEVEVDRKGLIDLMLNNRQIDLKFAQKKTDGNGYLTWDAENWTTVDGKKFIRCYSLEGRVLSESTGHNIYDLYNEFKPEDALKVELS